MHRHLDRGLRHSRLLRGLADAETIQLHQPDYLPGLGLELAEKVIQVKPALDRGGVVRGDQILGLFHLHREMR